ncbi:MAG: pyridoxamine kinase [Clostridia bacterium]|nr:pyridoxamine kinase [Clostridia bacterium]
MHQNRLPAVICVNDLSGMGRASLTVALPVLSAMGVQCCPLPTAILSSQTGYQHYSFLDFTPYMREYFEAWQKEQFSFDALYSGFLGSEDQIAIVREIAEALPVGTPFIVDPVMADHGRVYATYTDAMCARMRDLVKEADVITPNITEACILTDTAYTGEAITGDTAALLCKKLAALGPKEIVLTGVRTGEETIGNYLYTTDTDQLLLTEKPLSVGRYPGTGDLFASVFCGAKLRGESSAKAVDLAADFVSRATAYTAAAGTDPADGVLFEKCIHWLYREGEFHE